MNSSESLVILFALVAFLLPAVSCLFAYLIPERFKLTPVVSSILVLLSASCAVIVFINVWNHDPITFAITWFALGKFKATVGVLLNNQTVAMMVLVSLISSLVHFYSIGYMTYEPRRGHYFGMLGFFTSAMLGVVMANNVILIFFFWELIGFASYRLIGLREERPEASRAATKALIMTRLGDIVMFVGILLLWTMTGTTDISDLKIFFSQLSTVEISTLAGLCIFCGVIGKSAQFPLMGWLPDAMEGPTPVSALIHAATMVAAGVFLLGRLYFIFSPDALMIIAITGAITAFAGGINALFMRDIKRILAYSTISQLGLMVMTIGAGNPAAAETHLITHAIFKAGLFLAAGALIHIIHQHERETGERFDGQDLLVIAGLGRKIPFIGAVLFMTASSLAGIPFFSGFISKDEMLGSLYPMPFQIAGLIISVISVFYSFRLVWFLLKPKSNSFNIVQNLSTLPLMMRIPLIILAAGSLWLVLSLNPFVETSSFSAGLYIPSHSIPRDFRLASFLAIVASFGGSWLFFRNREVRGRKTALLNIDSFYATAVIKPVLKISEAARATDRSIDFIIHSFAYFTVTIANVIGWADKNILDGIVNGIAGIVRLTGNILRSTVNGKVQSYILWAVLAMIIFIASLLFT